MVSILVMVHLIFSGTGAFKIATFLGLQIGHDSDLLFRPGAFYLVSFYFTTSCLVLSIFTHSLAVRGDHFSFVYLLRQL